MVTGLNITKTANKEVWTEGALTYTVTITNNAAFTFVAPTITDILDPTLVELVDGSITINGTPAEPGDFTYNNVTGELEITLEDIPTSSSTIVTFQVNKAS